MEQTHNGGLESLFSYAIIVIIALALFFGIRKIYLGVK